MAVTLKVWHWVGHDNVTVSEFTLNDSADMWIKSTKEKGGFWSDGGFIPWHRINYVEVYISAN